jgi:hypothetical protein
MKQSKILVVATILSTLLVPSILEAQFVQGYVCVADSIGRGIASAHVEGKYTGAGGYFSTYTDSTGYYYVPNDSLPSGIWTVVASHPNYYPQKKEKQLPYDGYLNFYLQPRE